MAQQTAKEKAEELFDKYSTYAVMWNGGIEVEKQNCKQCALIAVDEIMYNCYEVMKPFWQEVKQEIEKN